MLKVLRTLLLLAACWPAASALAQKTPTGEEVTQRELIADTTTVEAGKPFYVGIHFTIMDGWHTYWKFPGGAGFPVKVDWTLPEGWKAGPVEFPLPEAITDPNGQVLYAYEHDVLFPVKLTPPAQLPAGEVKIDASLKWQVCKDTCIMGRDTLHLSLPGGAAQPAHADLFGKWMAQLPQKTPSPTTDVTFEAKGKNLIARVAGLPAGDHVEFFPVAPEDFIGTFDFGAKLGAANENGTRVFTYPFDSDVPANGWSGLLVVQKDGGPRTGWDIGGAASARSTAPATGTAPAPPASGSAAPAGSDGGLAAGSPAAREGYGRLLFYGFIGGLILNLMPCVLPVIGLKILGFMGQAGNSRRRVFQLGLAFCAGVFAFFYALALITIPLKASGVTLTVGWQFQNPFLLVGMLALFLGFGLNLLGVFELELSGDVSSGLSQASKKEGLGGAFVHGFFTTLMGFSCTAPFAAPAIGAALTQPGLRAIGLFSAMAAGLCLPYFMLSAQPEWMRFLPKPGTWMIRFKQTMGFVMIVFVVFFYKAMISRGAGAAIHTLYFLTAVGIACWLLGVFQEKRWRWPLAGAVIVASWFGIVQNGLKPESDLWQPYSEKAVQEAMSSGHPVFVDFTAEWCANCKAFEATVLSRESVLKAFKDKGVVLLRGDITNDDSPAAKEAIATLEKFGRSGVPFYLLYRKPNDLWQDDKLTSSGLMTQLEKL